jgi:hypothetical protein
MKNSFELDSARDLDRAFKPEVRREGTEIVHAGTGRTIADVEETADGRLRVTARDGDAVNYINRSAVE